MEARLFALQRLTAMAMAPFVLVHLGLIIYAVRGGLSAGAVLSRTQGSWAWILFYGLFVACVAVHVPIGLRNILVEWLRLGRRASSCIGLAFGATILFLACARWPPWRAAAMKSARNHQAYWPSWAIACPAWRWRCSCRCISTCSAWRWTRPVSDRFLKLSDMPAMKVGEWGLVLLLALHL